MLAVAVLAVVLIAMLFSLGGGGKGGGSAAAAGDRSSSAATVPASPTSAAFGTLSATPPATDPGRPGDGDSDGTGAAHGSTGTGGTGGSDPSGGGGTGGSGTGGSDGAVASSASAGLPATCGDGELRLVVAAAAPTYAVGQKPVLKLSVQNVSSTTCLRDLGAAQQEVLVYSGSTRLWSSNDCYPGGGQDVQELAPGGRQTFSVAWSGLSSTPQCKGTRSRVGAGHYTLVGRLGTLTSAKASLVLR